MYETAKGCERVFGREGENRILFDYKTNVQTVVLSNIDDIFEITTIIEFINVVLFRHEAICPGINNNLNKFRLIDGFKRDVGRDFIRSQTPKGDIINRDLFEYMLATIFNSQLYSIFPATYEHKKCGNKSGFGQNVHVVD